MEVNVVGTFIINVLIIIFSILFFGGAVAAALYWFTQYKKWSQFKCVIWGLDGFGQIVEKRDVAGIFVDKKTQNKRLFLKKNNVGLEADSVPYISSGKTKYIYLWQSGLKNFTFIKPRFDDNKLKFDVGEEDVNWAINAYEKQKKLFNTNMLLQYLPFIALAFTSIIILIMFIYFFKNFGVLEDVAVALKEAAQAYAQSQGGTVVIS